MLVYGHRGYSGVYPENTMLSFRMAVEAGCGGIELDVHLTKDGVPVVIHDETVDRTTNGTGAVRDLTYRQARRLSAGETKEKIPAFAEYCEWAAEQNLMTDVEIKTDNTWYPGIEQKLWDTVVRYGLAKRVLFSSFNHVSLLRMRQIAPEVPLGALVPAEAMVRRFPGAYCADAGFQAWHPAFAALDEENIRDCKEHGIQINVWTANGMGELENLYAWGCDGIITNYPGVASAWLAARESGAAEER